MTSRRVRASRFIIATVAFLILLKVGVGFYTSAISILSQAVDSSTDLIASFIAYYSIRKSLEPPDELHPYGHSNYENLASVIVGLIIIFASLLVIGEAVQRLITGGGVEMVGLGVAVMGAATLVNLLVSAYLGKVAREEASMALEADATYLRTDVLTNLGVFIGLLVIFFTGLNFIDPLIALGVSVFAIYMALQLIRKASGGLLDESISPHEERTVYEVLAEHASRFRSFHALKTRRGGSNKYIELHLEVKGDMTVQEAHDLADHLEREISGRLPQTTVTIHVEPEGFKEPT